MTYAELLSAVQTYLDNTETAFVALIPTFIRMAEKSIYQEAQLPVSKKLLTTLEAASGVDTVTMPADFLSMDYIGVTYLDEFSYLTQMDASFIKECYPYPIEGKPLYYAMLDNTTVLLGPTPDAIYDLRVEYFYYPGSIVDNGTSWLGTNFDTLLLHGTLVLAYAQMKGDADVLEAYTKIYQAELAKLKVFSAARSRNDQYRSGQFAAPMEG